MKVLDALIKDGIFYGKRYTVQAIYEIGKDKKSLTLVEYAVCKNDWIRDGDSSHLCPMPIKYFKDAGPAADDFMEREYGNKKT